MNNTFGEAGDIMTNEQCFFLTILADFLHNRKTLPNNGLDWTSIVQYAKSHQVEGIVCHQCREYLARQPELRDIYELLEKAQIATLFFYKNNQFAYNELKRVLNEKKIPFISVKGMDVASLYPVPEYRTMGDLDIVIHTEDSERIHDVMTGLGYKQGEGERVKTYGRGTTKIEIHNHLLNDDNLEIALRKKFFNRCWEYVSDEEESYILDWNFHFLYLVEHAKQHFSANGAGFRQFMDIAVVTMNKKGLDWKWIENELKKTGLWEFAITAFAFCKKWWNIETPFDIKDLDEEFYLESTEFVFKNGVFGFNNENASAHMVEKQMRISSLPKVFHSIYVAVKKVCISYDTAMTLPYCSFARNKKYLLPYVWIYRVVYVLVKKKGHIMKAVRLVFGSGAVIDNHRRLMDHWGI